MIEITKSYWGYRYMVEDVQITLSDGRILTPALNCMARVDIRGWIVLQAGQPERFEPRPMDSILSLGWTQIN